MVLFIYLFFTLNSDSSYVSKEYNFTKYNNTILSVQTYIFLYHIYGLLVGIVRYIHGTLELQMDQMQGWIKLFFFFKRLSMC